MTRCKLSALTIASAGYNAQQAVLEVEYSYDGQIWQYIGVPEELWYRLRREPIPDSFFHNHIKGHFEEKRVLCDVE